MLYELLLPGWQFYNGLPFVLALLGAPKKDGLSRRFRVAVAGEREGEEWCTSFAWCAEKGWTAQGGSEVQHKGGRELHGPWSEGNAQSERDSR